MHKNHSKILGFSGIFKSDKKSNEDYTIQNTDLKAHMSSNTGLLQVSTPLSQDCTKFM